MFLGDHTSPDNPGFVRVISEVLSRFHPQLRLNLISAGAAGQTAGGLKSRTLLDLLSSSRPDWLVVNLALADATREPPLVGLLHQYRARMAALEADFDETLGPLHRISERALGTRADSGAVPQIEWHRLPVFRSALTEAIGELRNVGVRCVLMTPVAVTNDLHHPLNLALRAYSRAIREIATAENAPLVDVERAFRDVLERATNYKQRVSLADEAGIANPQGLVLIARTFLNAFGLLPQPGFRPLR